MSDEVTLAVLREIRDEVRATRTDLSARIDATNERLDEMNERLGHVEHGLTELAQQQQFAVRWLKAGTRRDRSIEQRLLKLEKRVDAIEEHEREPKS